MSLEAILKNVYTFLDVLQMALSDRVESWDTDMVDNAIRWARYCQQLYEQAEGKPYRGDLDRQIQELGRLPWSLGKAKVDLEMMTEAENLIKKALLQNPCSPPTVLEYLLGLYQLETEEGREHFIQVCKNLNHDKSSLGLLTLVVPCLDTCADQLTEIELTSQAQLMVDFMYELVCRTPVHKQDRTTSFLTRKISALADRPGAIVLLTKILKSGYPNVPDVDANTVNRVKTIILHAIMELPVQCREEFKKLMSGLPSPV